MPRQSWIFVCSLSFAAACSSESDNPITDTVGDTQSASTGTSDTTSDDSGSDDSTGSTDTTDTTDTDTDTDTDTTDTGDACETGPLVLSKLKAFPTAYGAGSIASGGRGGAVIHVTNLDDDGPGSFRAALNQAGPRTVVFDVSGRIDLASRIELIDVHSDLTIAGETAPEGGITISGSTLLFSGGYNLPTLPTNNLIIRHTRFRNGSYTGEPDVFDHNAIISGGTERFIFDHLSFSFNDDQAISMAPFFAPLLDGTIQTSIFSENATGIILGVTAPFEIDRLSTLNNLFVHQSHRTPNISGDGRFDVINNVAFNWGARLTTVKNGAPGVNYIGNHLIVGEDTSNAEANNKVQLGGDGFDPVIYTANNYHSAKYPVPELDDRGIWSDFFTSDPVEDMYFTTTQLPLLAETFVQTAEAAKDAVLDDVGANAFISDDGVPGRYLDSYDTERINDVIDGVSRSPANTSWTQPVLPLNARPDGYYVTLPDIPEFFVQDHAISSNADIIPVYEFGDCEIHNDAGYTAFEMYLFYAAGDWDRLL
ncbi:Pectate lyase [Enhygromyxa salina]|uniref:Pectate lyase n=1 Tax=Enhygromyxa salina TaxID=215803 RepID=A0A0C2A319_9BACT|nr:hypothetical protein [Enhygromyxa salina]KIG17763.1 Pectate lyase [Enhygromyxa salina]